MNKYTVAVGTLFLLLLGLSEKQSALNDPYFSYGQALGEADPKTDPDHQMENYLAGGWHFLPARNDYQIAHNKAIAKLFEKIYGVLPEEEEFSQEFLSRACQKIQVAGQKNLDKVKRALDACSKDLQTEKQQHGACKALGTSLQEQLEKAQSELATCTSDLQTQKGQCKDLETCQAEQKDVKTRLETAETNVQDSLATIQRLQQEGGLKDVAHEQALNTLQKDLEQTQDNLQDSLAEIEKQNILCKDLETCQIERNDVKERLKTAETNVQNSMATIKRLQREGGLKDVAHEQALNALQKDLEQTQDNLQDSLAEIEKQNILCKGFESCKSENQTLQDKLSQAQTELSNAQRALTTSQTELGAERKKLKEEKELTEECQRTQQEVRDELRAANEKETTCAADLAKYSDIGSFSSEFMKSQTELKQAIDNFNAKKASKEETTLVPAVAQLRAALLKAQEAAKAFKIAFDKAFTLPLTFSIANEEEADGILTAEGFGG